MHAGQLLVAGPSLQDPNFANTVVVVLECSEDGALGLVTNRPSETAVADVLPNWQHLAKEPTMVFKGGPVSREGVLGLASIEPGTEPPHAQLIHSRLALLDLSHDAEEVSGHINAVRFFAGHAGWGSEQLQSELGQGGWYVVDAHPDDAVTSKPDELWRTVLTRKGGVFTTVAPDPSQN